MEWFDMNRRRDPVQRDPRGDWHIFGYAECIDCLGNYAGFSSVTKEVPATSALKLFGAGTLAWMDPPRHQELRSLINHGFSAGFVQGLEPAISAIVAHFMDRIRYKESVRFVDEFAFPIMLRSIAEMIGIPRDSYQIFGGWLKSLLTMGTGKENLIRLFVAQTREMDRVLHELIEERRGTERNDLMSKLVSLQPNGQVVDDDEVAGLIALLMGSAASGAMQSLVNVAICLDRFPETAARVREDRQLVDRLVEETMRYRGQTVRVGRRTTRDITLGGREIPADAAVSLWLSSANRDEKVFDDPDVFDIDRPPHPNLAFGRGIHFCVGASLGRMQIRLVLERLLNETTAFSVDYANSDLLDPRIICGARELTLDMHWVPPPPKGGG